MTKEDFQIIRSGITMEQVIASYGIRKNRKGMIKCPFHSGGNERTPSMSIRRHGFKCFGECGASGDIITFVSMYENLEIHDAAKTLADHFNIPISDTGEIDDLTRQKAREAILRHKRELLRQEQIRAELSGTSTLLRGYERAVELFEPYSDEWCTATEERSKLIGRWNSLWSEMRMI